jgi:transposase
MTKSYSLDLRQRVAHFVEAGHSCHAAAQHVTVSVAFVARLMAGYRATGSLAPKPEGGWRYSKLDPHREFLVRRVGEKGDITMPQLAAELLALGTRVTPAAISRWFLRIGYNFKKDATGQRTRTCRHAPSSRPLAHQAPAPNAAGAAAAGVSLRGPSGLDETGTSTKMTRLRGRCPKGQRLSAQASFSHWKTETFVAGLRCHELSAPWVIDGTMTRQIYPVLVRATRRSLKAPAV